MTTTTPAPALPALPTGPLLLEVEPGTFVDLAQVIEFQDIDGTCWLMTSAPTSFGKGAHVVPCEGPIRRIALGYARARAAAARAALEALADTYAADVDSPARVVVFPSAAGATRAA